MTTAIQLAGAFFGSLGFALLFGLPRRYLFAASLGGLLAWAVYLLTDSLLHAAFLSNLLAAAFSVFYADFTNRC